jgi:hypothetical protein
MRGENGLMSNEQFEKMMNRLDTLIKITAINAFQGKSISDVVRILSDLGFQNRDIAMILGTTNAYVANVKYEIKRQRGRKKKASDIKEVEKSDE